MISKMKAVQIGNFGDEPKVVEVDIPSVSSNEILVKMAYSTINPSDLMTIKGAYPSGLTLPSTLGFEGSGVVEQVGENCVVPHKVGDKVSILGKGTWGQYTIVKSESAFPISDGNCLQDAAAHFVNPATVVFMLETVKKEGHKAVIHDAGASALGKMLIRMLKQEGIKSINLVRKNAYFEELAKLGSDYHLNLTSDTFEADLAKIASEIGATAYFSAIAGEVTSKVLKAMPNGSTAYVYGGLSGANVTNLGVDDLIFKGKVVKGFWLTQLFSKSGVEEKMNIFSTVQKNLKTVFKTEFTTFGIEQISDALLHAQNNSSHSKALLKLNSFE